MLKKVLVIAVFLGICIMFIIPSGANPDEVILDDQVELAVPGDFELVDADGDQKPEAVKFKINLKAYREGDFIVSGNLEGMKNGAWLGLATTVVPFKWSPQNTLIELVFSTGNILKYRISGPYRVSLFLKDDAWELPEQVVGFSPKYSWNDFADTVNAGNGQIKTLSDAQRAAQLWAEYHSIKLGKLIAIHYNYDNWQIDYQSMRKRSVLRFLISPQGMIRTMKITKKNN